MMDGEIVSLKESIQRYQPTDASKRSSLAEELQYLHGQLMESRLFVINCLVFGVRWQHIGLWSVEKPVPTTSKSSLH